MIDAIKSSTGAFTMAMYYISAACVAGIVLVFISKKAGIQGSLIGRHRRTTRTRNGPFRGPFLFPLRLVEVRQLPTANPFSADGPDGRHVDRRHPDERGVPVGPVGSEDEAAHLHVQIGERAASRATSFTARGRTTSTRTPSPSMSRVESRAERMSALVTIPTRRTPSTTGRAPIRWRERMSIASSSVSPGRGSPDPGS